MSSGLRTFALHRDHDVSGVSGTGVVAVGVVMPSGKVVIEWLGDHPSVVTWDNLQSAIHVHGGATRFVFDQRAVV